MKLIYNMKNACLIISNILTLKFQFFDNLFVRKRKENTSKHFSAIKDFLKTFFFCLTNGL